ncbi:TonB-dependent receptor [Zhongshania sp.]|uniref:TonB-dependent receptor n=1 Tax=Zhongshania sp. TaxID=1971902 RepID=UPI0035662812
MKSISLVFARAIGMFCFRCVFLASLLPSMSGLLLAAEQAGKSNQENKLSRAIEEVIVTAQKRDEAVQDVPISLSVMTSDFIVEQGISDLASALLFVPNVKITAAGFFAAPNSRGFTFNNNNKAFEPPLGLAIDGIPYTRIPYFLAATFDLQRIEVLRGPQGTTFGKNTTAGLIHMITNDPTEELTAQFSHQQGELDRQRTELAVGGPLLEDLVEFRIAGFVDEREGYVRNTSYGTMADAQDRFLGYSRDGFRAKLAVKNLGSSQLKLSYEEVNLDDFGTGLEIIRANAEVRDFMRQFDPNADFEQGNLTASMDYPDGRRVNIKTYLAQWDFDIGEWHAIALAGHSRLKQFLEADLDFSPAPASFTQAGDSSPSDTAELRLISPTLPGLFGLEQWWGKGLGSSDFVLGAFYQKRIIGGSYFRFVYDLPVFLGLTAAAAGSQEGLAIPLAFELFPAQSEGTIYEDVTQNFDQRAESLSAFGEFKWHFREDWTLQAGLRYGQEDKDAQWKQYYNQIQPAVVLPQAGLEEFEAERAIQESQFQYKVSINWRPSNDVSLFFHKAEAVKGGGFNAFSFRDVDDELAFGPEYTTEYSLNVKTFWFDHTLALNLALYRMDVDDFQVLIRDADRANIGIGIARVTNAAKARAQGVEGDLQWRALTWLTLVGTLGYNETEYMNFTNNECPADRAEEAGCDASGKSFPFTPTWNNTLTGMFNFPLADSGLEMTASVTIEQYSEQFLDIDLDERKVQRAFIRYKASWGLSHPEQAWSIKIVGENLSDERSAVRQGDLFSGIFVELPEQPRLIYGQFTWQY